jgi:DNA-binding NarL/FixJ family response regulator
MRQVSVVVRAADAVTEAGLTSLLAERSDIRLVEFARSTGFDVLVLGAQRMTSQVLALMRSSADACECPLVLVTNQLGEDHLLSAVECRLAGLVPRARVTTQRLAECVLAVARGEAVMPAEVLGHVLRSVSRLQREVLAPRGLTEAGVTSREVDVLRLMAEGWDTLDVADKLCYSERAVKNIIYSLNERLQLRNRSHAVAYAVRSGLI